jgi:hypothetical protein
MKDLKEKLKEKGLKLVEKTNDFIDSTKEKIKHTLLNDQLKRRFQLENPHKMILSEDKVDVNLIRELTAYHAKIYEEDNVFVFYGQLKDIDVAKGYYARDLNTMEVFMVKDIAEVEIPVTYKEKIYDVPATAIYCEEV